MVRIAMIGAGSVEFCMRLVKDILCYESLSDARIILMDVDAKRVETTRRVLAHLRAQNGLDCTFSATTDRREALKGADFVITMVSVGGNEALRHDIEIPLKYGVDQCVGDTLNPGGVFRGLRHAPALLEVARDVRELCPEALLLNYANPMAICIWAVQRSFPDVRSVGLCHGTRHTTRLLCRWLDVPVEECEVLTAGINHMAWYLRFRHRGRDLYPRMWEKLDREGPIQLEQYRFEIMKATGFFCTESPGHSSEYLPYFRHRKDLRELFDGPWLFGETAGYLNEQLRTTARYEAEMAAMASGESRVPYEPGRKSQEYAAEIMNARLTGQPFRFQGNVLNKGLITNLPEDCCVEVPVFVDGQGFHPTHVGALPTVCAALCRSNISVQELAVEAALKGDYEAAYQACLLDPVTAAALAPHEIRNMVDELFEAEMRWLPQFQGKRNTAPGATIARLPTGAKQMKVGEDVYGKLLLEGYSWG
jgi:alpha-galactosidase